MNVKQTYKLDQMIRLILLIYYCVGILTIMFAPSSTILTLTPLTIILSLAVLFLGTSSWGFKEIITTILICALSFGIEVIGVNTGWPFGNYSYSSILGLQIMETPIIIGLNWMLLLWSAHDTLKTYFKNRIFIIVGTAILLLLLDFLIEPVAIKFQFWTWSNDEIPSSNYIAWFLIAFVLIIPFNVITKHTLPTRYALFVFCLQILFFLTFNLW